MENQENYDSSHSHQSNNDGKRQQSQSSFKHPYEGLKLPGDPLALTLGIIGLVLFFTLCWCYGVISIITLVISVAALIVANKSIAQYHADPERYSYNTFKSVQNAKIIGIIGIVISGLVTLILLILLLFFGSIFFAIMDGNWDKLDNLDDPTFYEENYYDDSLEESTDDWQYYENDTIPETIDSTSTLQIDTIPVEE
jgi:hypothetical protein